MSQTCVDPDPYAELDNRADAGELSEDFRKPIRTGLGFRRQIPTTLTQLRMAARANRI
jgi:hypothetical protein